MIFSTGGGQSEAERIEAAVEEVFDDLSNVGIKAEVVDKSDVDDVRNVVENVIETIVDDIEAVAASDGGNGTGDVGEAIKENEAEIIEAAKNLVPTLQRFDTDGRLE